MIFVDFFRVFFRNTPNFTDFYFFELLLMYSKKKRIFFLRVGHTGGAVGRRYMSRDNAKIARQRHKNLFFRKNVTYIK